MFRNLFYFILFFLLIFGPVFNKLGAWADTIFIFSILISLINCITSRKWLPNYISPLFILFPLFIIVTILLVMHPDASLLSALHMFMRPIRVILTATAGYTLVRFYLNGKVKLYDIYKLIFLSVAIHALIMFFQFYSPAFRDIIYAVTTSGEFRSSFEYDFRMGGLSGGTGGAILSVVQSIGIIIMPFFIRRLNIYNKIIYLVLAALIFYSVLICGRSGLWCIILFLPLSIFISDVRLKLSTFLSLIFALVACATVLITCLYLVTEYVNDDIPVVHALRRTLDTFVLLEESGVFRDKTVEVLIDHIIFPDDLVTFLFGDIEHQIHTQTDRTLNSDIGYIRNLWSFGIFGLIIFILPMFIYLKQSFVYLKSLNSSAVLFILSIIIILFHCKENFMYTRMLFSIYSIILAVFHFEKLAINIHKNRINSVFGSVQS